MDRNAKIMSVGVLVFAVAMLVYLAWNPRGMPRYGGWLFHRADMVRTDSSSFSPAQIIGEVAASPSGHIDEATRVSNHFARLAEASLEITQDEIATVAGNSVYDGVIMLRPYWLNDDLHAAVRVGGQLVGDVDVLDNIPLASIDIMRLEFSVTEPHWIIQLFMK